MKNSGPKSKKTIRRRNVIARNDAVIELILKSEPTPAEMNWAKRLGKENAILRTRVGA